MVTCRPLCHGYSAIVSMIKDLIRHSESRSDTLHTHDGDPIYKRDSMVIISLYGAHDPLAGLFQQLYEWDVRFELPISI